MSVLRALAMMLGSATLTNAAEHTHLQRHECSDGSCDDVGFSDPVNLLQVSIESGDIHGLRANETAQPTQSAMCTSYPGEKTIDGEEAATQALLDMFTSLSEANLPLRAGHLPTLGCLSGTFEVNPKLPAAFKKGLCSTSGQSALARISDFKPGFEHALAIAVKVFDADGSASQDLITVPFQADFHDQFEWTQQPQENARLLAMPGNENIVVFHDSIFNPSSGGGDESGMTGMLDTDAVSSSKAPTDPNGFTFDTHGCAPINWADENSHRGLRFWFDAPFLNSSCFQGKQPEDWNTCSDPAVVEEALEQTMSGSDGQLVVSMWGQLQGCTDEIEENGLAWTSTEIAELGKFKFNRIINSEVCEFASFTPWNKFPSHKPLSSFNRARKSIYYTVQQMRKNATANSVSDFSRFDEYPEKKFWCTDWCKTSTQDWSQKCKISRSCAMCTDNCKDGKPI